MKMANEQRLIDANALYEKATRAWDDTLCDECYSEIINLIDEAHAVDAVEVVRCKECKYFKKGKPFRHECKKVGGGMFYPNPDDFCSYGERRDVR